MKKLYISWISRQEHNQDPRCDILSLAVAHYANILWVQVQIWSLHARLSWEGNRRWAKCLGPLLPMGKTQLEFQGPGSAKFSLIHCDSLGHQPQYKRSLTLLFTHTTIMFYTSITVINNFSMKFKLKHSNYSSQLNTVLFLVLIYHINFTSSCFCWK